jgi:hypothetical protein
MSSGAADVTSAAQAKQAAATSLAVWDVPATAVAGERFTVKIGVKSSTDSDLRGHAVAIHDASGATVGKGQLGRTPWPGTSALYWADVPLPAPDSQGIATLTARFSAAGLMPPHTDASAQISLAVVRAPDHTLTVKVVETDGAKPIAGVEIRLGAYRAVTDASGMAVLRVCKGDYQLHIWKVGYEAPPTTVTVASDTAIQVDAVVLPEENADRAWKG